VFDVIKEKKRRRKEIKRQKIKESMYELKKRSKEKAQVQGK
jgi:hypothetical protein